MAFTTNANAADINTLFCFIINNKESSVKDPGISNSNLLATKYSISILNSTEEEQVNLLDCGNNAIARWMFGKIHWLVASQALIGHVTSQIFQDFRVYQVLFFLCGLGEREDLKRAVFYGWNCEGLVVGYKKKECGGREKETAGTWEGFCHDGSWYGLGFIGVTG